MSSDVGSMRRAISGLTAAGTVWPNNGRRAVTAGNRAAFAALWRKFLRFSAILTKTRRSYACTRQPAESMFTPEMEMRIRPPSSVRGAMAEVAGDREVADNPTLEELLIWSTLLVFE